MEKITRDLAGVAVYLDDILVSGCNAVDHLDNLRALLQRLQDKGLQCKLEKCTFAQPSIEYLGHTLSCKGVSKGHKVEAVMKRPAPKNANELGLFLVQFSYMGNGSLICQLEQHYCLNSSEKINHDHGLEGNKELSKILESV